MSANGATGFWNTHDTVEAYSNKNKDLFKPTTSKVVALAEELIDQSTATNIIDLASGTGNPAIHLALAFPRCKIHANGMNRL